MGLRRRDSLDREKRLDEIRKRIIRSPFRVGSVISKMLSLVGVTEDRVKGWLGRPCGCRQRREKMNALSDLTYSVLRGKITPPEAKTILDTMMGGADTSPTPETPPPSESAQ